MQSKIQLTKWFLLLQRKMGEEEYRVPRKWNFDVQPRENLRV